MADNLTLNPGALGETLATDDILGAHHQRVKMEHGGDGVATEVTGSTPLPVDTVPNSPKRTHAVSTSVPAGNTVSLDSDQITAGLTGKLITVSAEASVFLKAELFTVLNGVASAVLMTWFPSPLSDGVRKIPGKGYLVQAQDAGVGFDGFRVDITNLDPSQAADVYANFFFDEDP